MQVYVARNVLAFTVLRQFLLWLLFPYTVPPPHTHTYSIIQGTEAAVEQGGGSFSPSTFFHNAFLLVSCCPGILYRKWHTLKETGAWGGVFSKLKSSWLLIAA